MSLKDADLAKIKTVSKKVEAELENVRILFQFLDSNTLKEEITKITSVVVLYNQGWKYYTQILTTIKKEIEEADSKIYYQMHNTSLPKRTLKI